MGVIALNIELPKQPEKIRLLTCRSDILALGQYLKENESENPEYYLEVAHALKRIKEYKIAFILYSKFVDLSSGDKKNVGLFHRAMLLQTEENYTYAIRNYLAISANSQYYVFQNLYLAYCYSKLGDKLASKKHLDALKAYLGHEDYGNLRVFCGKLITTNIIEEMNQQF